jgi:hypothetical protein
MKIDFNKMTVAEFLTICNEALKPLTGMKYTPQERGITKVHDAVIDTLAGICPEGLKVAVWRIQRDGLPHYCEDVFRYDIEDKRDQRFRERDQGTVISVILSPVTSIYDHSERKELELVAPDENMLMQEWFDRIEMRWLKRDIQSMQDYIEEAKKTLSIDEKYLRKKTERLHELLKREETSKLLHQANKAAHETK